MYELKFKSIQDQSSDIENGEILVSSALKTITNLKSPFEMIVSSLNNFAFEKIQMKLVLSEF